MCNLPYSEKPFISRIVLSWTDRLWLSVSGTEDYHHFTDRYYSSVGLVQELDNQKCKYIFGFLTLCPCCTNFSGKTVHLVARQAFKNPWRPGCGNFSKRDDRKGLKLLTKYVWPLRINTGRWQTTRTEKTDGHQVQYTHEPS
jgi:hypothetical protein